MYSDQDIDGAVAAGAISAEAAASLRRYMASGEATSVADEENFRLLSGFNDIFVGLASIILLTAMGWIGQAILLPLAGVLVAATAWGLAEYFTRVRRMALPSIILLLAFVGGIAAALGMATEQFVPSLSRGDPDPRLMATIFAGIGLITAGAAWLHWRRFMVPITIAAGAAALVATIIALLAAVIGPLGMPREGFLLLLLAGGIGMFLFAMWWDRSDTARVTRRSDVAFWLHLAAAPMIAHPLFALLGVTEGAAITMGAALGVVGLYIVLGLVALAIDRRALLVSALAYVLFAMTELFRQFGAVELNVALTALVIGSALLLLSAFWQPARALVIGWLPGGVRAMVPSAGLAHAA